MNRNLFVRIIISFGMVCVIGVILSLFIANNGLRINKKATINVLGTTTTLANIGPTTIPSLTNILIIPKELTDFVANLIPNNYILSWYYFSENQDEYRFYFDAEKDKHDLYPTITLYKNNNQPELLTGQILTNQFNINGYHFSSFRTNNTNNPSIYGSQCVTQTKTGFMSIEGAYYMWGDFRDCEDFLKNVLSDDYLYPSPLYFKEAQTLYTKLIDNFRECERSFVLLSSKQNLFDTNPLPEAITIDFICQDIKFHISSRSSSKQIIDCCANTKQRFGIIDGYQTCSTDYGTKASYTGEEFKYKSDLNTKDYYIEIQSNKKPKPLYIKKIVNAFNSENIGFRRILYCQQRGI